MICTREFFRIAERDLANAGIQLPATYEAKLRLLESFSPKTLNNEDCRPGLDRYVHHGGPRS